MLIWSFSATLGEVIEHPLRVAIPQKAVHHRLRLRLRLVAFAREAVAVLWRPTFCHTETGHRSRGSAGLLCDLIQDLLQRHGFAHGSVGTEQRMSGNQEHMSKSSGHQHCKVERELARKDFITLAHLFLDFPFPHVHPDSLGLGPRSHAFLRPSWLGCTSD